jgi:hypothetical protein
MLHGAVQCLAAYSRLQARRLETFDRGSLVVMTPDTCGNAFFQQFPSGSVNREENKKCWIDSMQIGQGLAGISLEFGDTKKSKKAWSRVPIMYRISDQR